jgi:hypothetical protein
MSQNSSCSKITVYRLDFLTGQDFSLHHHNQTGSGTHPVSYPLTTWGSFLGAQNSCSRKLAHHHYLIPRFRIHGTLPPPPIKLHVVVLRLKGNFTFLFIMS